MIGEDKMAVLTKYPEPLVFGLDIGTRSIVGTVGYKEGKQFHIVAQSVIFHETRAMIEGQIHDINKVGEEIIVVKEDLEEQLGGRKLKDVCVAAAGRMLKTAVGKGEYEFQENTAINQEYVHSLEMLGVEKAQEKMQEENDTDMKFFCVGYTVMKYYMNGYEITNLEGHKAKKIETEVLGTFLPEDVVDGLYAAVEIAGLQISNMTLEPIAAINVAIPENYRLLNIALVDVGAGTSDISITKESSIIGYGMLPKAGDELTEQIVSSYLVDFATAEEIKSIDPSATSITYKDIMGIEHEITPKDVYEQLDSVLEDITKGVADKIIELNGGKSVSAVFVVGGGGKLPDFTTKLAKHLGLPPERVALRGEEVLGFVNIMVDGVTKDSLMVTPIGICLNFYEQKNQFVYLHVNDQRIKLYNNDKLTVFDAALAYGLTNEAIFPKRGKDLHYKLNGHEKFIRGKNGEPARILVNDKVAGMNQPIQAGDQIRIEESTRGEAAKALLGDVADFTQTLTIDVNDTLVYCPKYASVNGKLEFELYEIAEGDCVEILNYYTLSQLMQFMDIETPHEVYVNGARANADTQIYENFKVAWIAQEEIYKPEESFLEKEIVEISEEAEDNQKQKDNLVDLEENAELLQKEILSKQDKDEKVIQNKEKQLQREKIKTTQRWQKNKNRMPKANMQTNREHAVENKTKPKVEQSKKAETVDMQVTVNGKEVTLTGKANYVFVDIFDKYEFDLKHIGGTELIQQIDGKRAEHFSPLHAGAIVEIYWKK